MFHSFPITSSSFLGQIKPELKDDSVYLNFVSPSYTIRLPSNFFALFFLAKALYIPACDPVISRSDCVGVGFHGPFSLGQAICFGQWNISRPDVSHSLSDTLRATTWVDFVLFPSVTENHVLSRRYSLENSVEQSCIK